MDFRQHQRALGSYLDRWSSDRRVKILAWVVPGGGKSWLPAIVARRFPGLKIAWFVPRLNLRQQAAESLNKLGISVWESENDINPSRGTRGFVATHQGLTTQPDLYIHELERQPYILVVDESHHAKVRRNGERNELAAVLPRLKSTVELHMTGTLDTNDDSFIYGVEYEESASGWIVRPEKSADIYIRYDRRTALDEKALVPIEFYHHNGPVRFIDGEGEKHRTLSDPGRKKERSAKLFTALRTDLAMQLLDQGVAHWRQCGDQLIVVADYQVSARKYHDILVSRGIESALAITEEGAEAQEAVKAYRRKQVRVLTTCAMAYEGLDAPDTTHLVCLTHIRSIPWIEQMLGRTWRWSPGKSQCWAFVPDDPDMNDVITRIRADEPSEVGAYEPGPGGNGTGPSVVPISSDVDSTRAEYLDADAAMQEARARVLAAFQGLNLSADHPLFSQTVEAVVQRKTQVEHQPTEMTESEKAKQLRASITNLCRRADKGRDAAFGTTQRELYQKTKVLFDKATPRELERVALVATQFCEKFVSG